MSVDEGLPQSFVSGLIQDDKGFIWIGTRNGLARYDGHRFTIFQSNLKNKSSLSSNFITNVKKGIGRSLLIQYENGGIDKFGLDSEKASPLITANFFREKNIFPNTKAWLISAKNILWFRGNDGKPYSIDLKKNGPVIKQHYVPDKVINLLEDKNKVVWVLGEKSISHYDSAKQSFNTIFLPEYLNFTKVENRPSAFYERRNGELMWADDNVLCFYDTVSKNFSKKQLPSKSPYPIRLICFAGNKEYFVAGNIVYSYNDRKGFSKVSSAGLTDNTEAQTFLIDKSHKERLFIQNCHREVIHFR